MLNLNQSSRLIRVVYFRLVMGILLLIASVSLQAKEVTQQYLGLTINANLELAHGKALQDGVVLLLHGAMAHNRMEIIEASQQALLDNGQSSLAINLSLGIDNRHGYYDCAWPNRHTLNGSLDELDTWVNWLREQGVDRIVIMGHSFGANQVMVYAVERHHPSVTHLVLLAPNTTSDSKVHYEARYGEILDENIERVKKQIDTGKGDELIDNLDFSYCPQASVSANSFYSIYRPDNKFRQIPFYLSKMPVPTFIVTGTQDELQPNIARDVAPFVDGSRIRLGVVENSDHFFRDFNIEEAVEAAVEFIAESE